VILRSERLSSLIERSRLPTLGPPDADPEITGVALDSRKTVRGGLFVAVRGFVTDGESYVADALARGARAIVAASARPAALPQDIAWVRVDSPRRAAALLAREWFGRPDEALALVGITGTNGKTTVTYLLEAIANAAGSKAGRIGTISSAWGGRETAAARTTPEAPDLFETLAAMRAEGVGLVAMEVSSHALALGRVEGARFAIAAFLNFGRDHLDFHGDVDAYFAAKASLFDGLSDDRTAVLNADDPRSADIAARTRARILRFASRAENADVRLSRVRCDPHGCSAELEIGTRRVDLRTELRGRFNLDNVAAAAACAIAAGIPFEAVPEGVRSVRRIPGRMEAVEEGQPFAVLVDFAHTDTALARLLDSVREFAAGRVIVVFGCGGDRDRTKRPAMGRAAAERADLVVLTSDNPRGEDPEAILCEIRSGISAVEGAETRCRTIVDREQAVAFAVAAARPGDTVVIAGKGHETTQTLGDHVEPMDDRELVRSALRKTGRAGGHRAAV
jgi:UDP-N-acetylmuramoyl-L-alanyl-D-glutamate--2,6-diaminopimelate ligase